MSDLLAPLDVGPIAARLRTQVTGFRDVGEAAELAAALERPGALPAGYAVLEAETFDARDYTEHGQLTIVATVAILIAVRNYRVGERGAAHADTARAFIGATRAALTGWTPPVPAGVEAGSMRPQGQAKVLHYDQTLYWWVDRYQILREVIA